MYVGAVFAPSLYCK